MLILTPFFYIFFNPSSFKNSTSYILISIGIVIGISAPREKKDKEKFHEMQETAFVIQKRKSEKKEERKDKSS